MVCLGDNEHLAKLLTLPFLQDNHLRMQAVSSRPYTPSHSPPHSTPVRIPPAPPTDLHVANALRFKHLYGYTQGSSVSSFPSGDTESPSSEAQYDTPVFETGSEIVIDERDRSSNSELDTPSSSTGSLSTSPPLFPLSTVNSVTPHRAAESVPSKATIENVEEAEEWEDRALTPRMTPFDPDADLVDPITDNFSLGDMDCPPVLPEFKATENPLDSRPNTGHPLADRTAMPTRRRRLRTSPRPTSAQSLKTRALAPMDDEFRCMTCHHAGLCADLVMKDPNFRCGDTISSTASGSAAEANIAGGAGGKTPWTRQNLRGISFGDKQTHVKEKERNGLRVLEGGIDYVHYEEADERNDPGGRRSPFDLEDIGRAISATSTRNSADEIAANGSDGNIAAGGSSFPRVQQNAAFQAAHIPASGATSYDSSSDATSSSQGMLSDCANTIVHLEPALNTSIAKSSESRSPDARQKEYYSPSRLPNSGEDYGRSRSRPRGNPIWKLHNLTAGSFVGSSPNGREDDGRYDYDDELYGVDVVNRGRNRLH